MRLKHVKGADLTIKEGKYYLDNPKEYKGVWSKYFKNNNPINIEIGMGKGKFLIELAQNNPNINYIGIEKYDSVLVRAVQTSNELELNNLVLLRYDAQNITDLFDHEISLLYLNFSDPWPKDRHAKRRLTSREFLTRYDSIFKGNKKIIMKTDNIDLFEFSLNSLKEHGYNIDYISYDLHKDKENIITTEYEDKFTKMLIKINYLEASKEMDDENI